MAREVSVTMRVQLINAPKPETTAIAAMKRPTHALWEHRLVGVDEGGTGLDQRVVRHQPHHRRRHGDVEEGAGPGAEEGCPHDVAARVAHPLGDHGCALDADEGEQRHTGGDPDAL